MKTHKDLESKFPSKLKNEYLHVLKLLQSETWFSSTTVKIPHALDETREGLTLFLSDILTLYSFTLVLQDKQGNKYPINLDSSLSKNIQPRALLYMKIVTKPHDQCTKDEQQTYTCSKNYLQFCNVLRTKSRRDNSFPNLYRKGKLVHSKSASSFFCITNPSK